MDYGNFIKSPLTYPQSTLEPSAVQIWSRPPSKMQSPEISIIRRVEAGDSQPSVIARGGHNFDKVVGGAPNLSVTEPHSLLVWKGPPPKCMRTALIRFSVLGFGGLGFSFSFHFSLVLGNQVGSSLYTNTWSTLLRCCQGYDPPPHHC